MQSSATKFVAIVGVDGSGKSQTFNGALAGLSRTLCVAGVGDTVVSGGPDVPLHQRTDIPGSRLAGVLGRTAKTSRLQWVYKNLKFLELTERAHIARYLAEHEAPSVVLSDGHPLINASAWAVSRYYREQLSDDDELYKLLVYLSGEKRISPADLPRYAVRSWQLTVLNLLHIANFGFPDIIFLLDIPPAIAMERILARGKPLQSHENEEFLEQLSQAYTRVCSVLERKRGVQAVRLPVTELTREEVVERVVSETLGLIDGPGATNWERSRQELLRSK